MDKIKRKADLAKKKAALKVLDEEEAAMHRTSSPHLQTIHTATVHDLDGRQEASREQLANLQ